MPARSIQSAWRSTAAPQLVLRCRRASRGPSRGSRRRPRAAPRSSRRPRAARTPRRGRRGSRVRVAVDEPRDRAEAASRRAPRRRRRAPPRSRIGPPQPRSPPSQSTNASSTTSTSRSAGPRSGALAAESAVTSCARSRTSRREDALRLMDAAEAAPAAEPVLLGGGERLVVAGVGVAHDAGARIGRQHALEPLGHLVGAVGDDDHARVDRVADADAAAVVDADPGRAGGDVQQRVQDRPVGDRVGAVLHRLGLAVGRRDRAGVEVVAADDDRRLDLAAADELVDREPGPGAIAVAEPADPRGQPLERDALGRQRQPALQRVVVREELEQHPVDGGDVGRIARQRGPAERPDARGRTAAGCRPGRSPGMRRRPSTPASCASPRRLLP